MPEKGFLEVGGRSLEFSRWPAARAGGPVLVLLHEGLGCVALWRSFPAALAQATGLETFAYSRAGYGASSPVSLPRPVDYMEREALDVLPGVIDQAGRGNCVLVGHSDGASIAIVYAGATADPRLRGLVLMAPHVMTEDLTVATIEHACESYEHGDLRTRLARYHGDNVECAFRGWGETWTRPAFRAWNIERYLPPIRVPVLTVRGADDPYSSAIHVERIAASAGSPVQSVGFESCGHAPHLERAGATLRRVAAFIAGL